MIKVPAICSGHPSLRVQAYVPDTEVSILVSLFFVGFVIGA